MTFIMTYDQRNLNNINKLAYNTKKAALQWYRYCCEQEIDLLIYETTRTLEEQARNYKSGASQTMRSYHLVGQALDFVPVKDRLAIWNGFDTPKIKNAIAKAKQLGFTWGGDWTTLVDKVHLQYEYNGYGTDPFGSVKETATAPRPIVSQTVLNIQKVVNSRYGTGLKVDGRYGPATNRALLKGYQIELNEQYKAGLMADGIWGPKTKAAVRVVKKGARGNITYILQATLYVRGFDSRGIDGIFGANTEMAVKSYQKSQNLNQDGVAGRDTWTKIFE
ncbi:peptidoglycan-binding protein [Peribacillus huizhouensis]|uniref:Peptidoglycan L-alanyl-D-glutamate endopeptidase CwlK n=1 Tax=Peribacillus huizhouensis TaxID=1501239 RepID=A0ABR6CQQ6_9BACI|nr:peptidoglycan-binding protein [Peribacillus huizhouensis]MBA9026968.1 peptidoglycan L-alanyl-D-glutamate endopeptidase CwlK [Peribacillus huizhouensis]